MGLVNYKSRHDEVIRRAIGACTAGGITLDVDPRLRALCCRYSSGGKTPDYDAADAFVALCTAILHTDGVCWMAMDADALLKGSEAPSRCRGSRGASRRNCRRAEERWLERVVQTPTTIGGCHADPTIRRAQTVKRERADFHSGAKRWRVRSTRAKNAIQHMGPSANVGGSGDRSHVVANRSEPARMCGVANKVRAQSAHNHSSAGSEVQ